MRLCDLIPPAFQSPGLSDRELDVVQARAGTRFPPDLCDLLQQTVPKGAGFPPWREDPQAVMERWYETLVDGVLFDVAEADVWDSEWGRRPADLEEAKEVVRSEIRAAPVLIPIY